MVGFRAEVTKVLKTQSYSLIQIHVKGYKFDTQTFEIKICTICLHIMLSLILKIRDIYQCEDSNNAYAVVRTSLWVTHMVHTSNMVPSGTMLVSPGLICY